MKRTASVLVERQQVFGVSSAVQVHCVYIEALQTTRLTSCLTK